MQVSSGPFNALPVHTAEQAQHMDNFHQWLRFTGSRDPFQNETHIAAHPVAQELIHNDGSHTYTVHNGNSRWAPQVMEEGFTFTSNSTNPHLDDTTYMLARPGDAVPQEAFNTLLMEYRRRDSQGSKIILEFPFEKRPDSDRDRVSYVAHGHAFDDTPLSTVGEYIEKVGDLWTDGVEEKQKFRVPRTFVKGWFDLDTGEFHPNPHFGERETLKYKLREKVHDGLRALGLSRR